MQLYAAVAYLIWSSTNILQYCSMLSEKNAIKHDQNTFLLQLMGGEKSNQKKFGATFSILSGAGNAKKSDMHPKKKVPKAF